MLGQDGEMHRLTAQVKSRRRERKGLLKAVLQGCFFPLYLQVPSSSSSLLQLTLQPAAAPGLPDQAHTLGVSSPWGSSYAVAVSRASYTDHPVLMFLNLASDKLLCLPPFLFFPQDTHLVWDPLILTEHNFSRNFPQLRKSQFSSRKDNRCCL